MIASVVATLQPAPNTIQTVLSSLQQEPAIETGDVCDLRLPMTIEAEDSRELMAVTRQIQNMEGIRFVDVVFVSFEDTPEYTPEDTSHTC